MRIPRIYHPGNYQTNAEVPLTKDACHHLARVLRAKVDDPITLFNGQGQAFEAQIISITKNQCLTKVGKQLLTKTESPINIHLAQGIAKGEKMDFIIQKAIELGVNQITPLFTRFGDVKLSEERQAKKIAHWQKVIINACEQCGRNTLATINPPITLAAWLNNLDPNGFHLLLEPTANKTLQEFKLQSSSITIAIGPEGGFAESELKLAKDYSLNPVRLGPRILRTETAALSTISVVQLLWGDF